MKHNKMKKLSLLIWLVLLLKAVLAQELQYDVFLINESQQLLENQILENSNLIFIFQTKTGKNIIQSQQNHGLHSNQLFTDQNGISNNTFINQTGTSHATGLIQKGNFNDAQINSIGQLTSTVVNQNGDWNKVNFSIENIDDFLKAAQVLQTGNNNLVDLKITGSRLFWESDVKDAVVAQTGNNHSFSAVLDSYKSPIVVNQQAGPNGEGMKVDISTSDFYFPNK